MDRDLTILHLLTGHMGSILLTWGEQDRSHMNREKGYLWDERQELLR